MYQKNYARRHIEPTRKEFPIKADTFPKLGTFNFWLKVKLLSFRSPNWVKINFRIDGELEEIGAVRGHYSNVVINTITNPGFERNPLTVWGPIWLSHRLGGARSFKAYLTCNTQTIFEGFDHESGDITNFPLKKYILAIRRP
jgi:hypothetical protein